VGLAADSTIIHEARFSAAEEFWPMNTADQIFSQALSLPTAERKALAIQLLDSLPVEDSSVELDADYEAEIHRRLEEIDSGNAKMHSLEEVMQGLLRLNS
jgi:putative addiction module component (TIGR02574 family)